jgi:hypothetical protein
MTQVKNGNAFEYACVIALHESVSKYQKVVVINDQRLFDCKDDFESFSADNRNMMLTAARGGVNSILDCEPYLTSPNTEGLEIRLNSSSTGAKGDVRDVLVSHKSTNWEIGISSKHNHNAVKHQRLSPTINFGRKWFQVDTPAFYYEELRELWGYLREQQRLATPWSALNKSQIYQDVLSSFIRALETMSRENYDVAPRFMEYLLGRHDFYKIIVLPNEKQTVVRAFNIHNTLHCKSINGVLPRSVSRMGLPKKILKVDHVDDANLIVYFDKGWTVKMRIHSASTIAEPSLKFDVQLQGVPDTMLSMMSVW